MSETVPEFGERVAGQDYRRRDAVYAVIRDDAGRIATVRTRRGHFLPGGGIEAGETAEQCLEREVREECARAIAILHPLGRALQWFRARGGWFEGRHAFFAARFASEPSGEGEHELVWLEPARAAERLAHASHVWAIGHAPATPPAELERWFSSLHDATAAHYLAQPGNPYRESGRSSGAERWQETRRCIADAVDRGGDFMDVGCANGLLLETLIEWCREREIELTPHGIDFVEPLVALARARHPAHAARFEVANAFTWQPTRRYDFVRVSLEIVPAPERATLLRRLFERAVKPRGRLIVCHYADVGETPIDVAGFLTAQGYRVVGRSSAPNVALAWTDRGADEGE